MKKLLFTLVLSSTVFFSHAQTKSTEKFYQLGGVLMESYYAMNFSLQFSNSLSDCPDVLKRKLKTLCDTLQACIDRDKPRLAEKLSEQDIKDLEFQLWNYKEFAKTRNKDIRPLEMNSLKLWIKIARVSVERLFILLMN